MGWKENTHLFFLTLFANDRKWITSNEVKIVHTAKRLLITTMIA